MLRNSLYLQGQLQNASMVANTVLDIRGRGPWRSWRWKKKEMWTYGCLSSCRVSCFTFPQHTLLGLQKRGVCMWKDEDYGFLLLILRRIKNLWEGSGAPTLSLCWRTRNGGDAAPILMNVCELNGICYVSTCIFFLNSILIKANTLDHSYVMEVFS